MDKVLKRKNPYLFKAKNIRTAGDLVKGLLDAHLSSQEEAIFGTFLEGLAVYVSGMVYGGRKSASEGIDLEFEKEGTHYIISVKSGPNWGNSRQIAKMKDDFRRAKRILQTNTSGRRVVAVNGCCYGRNRKFDKGEYLKLCGQRFWSLISADENFYTDIIEPLGHEAKQRNEAFMEAYEKVVNRFTLEFIGKYCAPDGGILWDNLVRMNSAA